MPHAVSGTDRAAVGPNGRRGFTLTELFFVVLIIGVLIALSWPQLTRNAGGRAARRSACKHNLKQIGIALHNYADTYGTLPPAYTVDADGKPLHSWRALILPFVEQPALYESIDLTKPWNDPANAKARATVVPQYACPSVTLPAGMTTYLALTGPGEAFSASGRPFPESDRTAGETVAVVEVAATAAVPWMQPRDTDADAYLKLLAAPGLPHDPGAQVLVSDGSVRFVSAELPPDEMPSFRLPETAPVGH